MCLCVAPVRFMSRVCCFQRQTTQCVLRPTLKQNNHESNRVTLVIWRYGEHIQYNQKTGMCTTREKCEFESEKENHHYHIKYLKSIKILSSLLERTT